MLDTIALTLDHRQFDIRAMDRFSPSARGVFFAPFYPLGARGFIACVLNPTKAERAEGPYRPRLTLTKRQGRTGFVTTLRIEFSAPKLLFGNNFDELTQDDLARVVDTLRQRLGEMGVTVARPALLAAPVSAIHYSKNIVYTDFTTCSMVLAELGRIDLSQRLDLSHTDYRNEGHAIRFHANSYELTFYDKIRDLKKAAVSEKRAIENDSRAQLGLFAAPGEFPRPFEVLRMELRLGSRARIKAELGRAGIVCEPTLAALFDRTVAQGLLRWFWADVRRRLPVSAGEARPEDIVTAMARTGGRAIKPAKLLQWLGGHLLVQSIGMRGAKALLEIHGTPRAWQRIKRELKAVSVEGGAGRAVLKPIEAALIAFVPLRLSDYRNRAAEYSMAITP